MENNLKLKQCVATQNSKAEVLHIESFSDYKKRLPVSSSKDPILHLSTKWGMINPTRTVKVIANDNYTCVSCKRRAEYVSYQKSLDTNKIYTTFWIQNNGGYISLTKDHIVAKAIGGTDAFVNLQSMCYACNQEKADDIVEGGSYKNVPSSKALVDKDVHVTLQRKSRHFKYARKKINKIRKQLPWYYRIIGVGRYLDKNLVEPMQDKGYFNGED